MEFIYKADISTFRDRLVPGQPGVKEYMFYTTARDLPVAVPHGCNPREQNIDRPTYKKVTASFLDLNDRTFHLKNKGITVLAKSVRVREIGTRVELTVEIPESLGNVDGQHTYQIMQTYCDENPEQMVRITILESLPQIQIPKVAEGLNTSVQVTTATMANHSGLFDPIHAILRSEPYYRWIGWKDNQENTSIHVRTLIQLMWACHPEMFPENSARSPVWVYARPQTVYDSGFYKIDSEIRTLMLQMVPVLPRLIEIFKYLNEEVPKRVRKPGRKVRGVRHEDADGRKPSELNTKDLFQNRLGVDLGDPSDKKKSLQMRDSYRTLIMSGMRALLKYNPRKGHVEWRLSRADAFAVLDSCLNKILKDIVQQLKSDKGDHNTTTRQPALFNSIYMSVERALNKFEQQAQTSFPELSV